MCDQNSLLRLFVPLGAVAEPMTISTLALRAKEPRKAVIACLGRLTAKKLVERVTKRKGFGAGEEPLYVATKTGAAFARAGKRLTSGPNGPHTGARKPIEGSFRARLWNAFRMQKKATLNSLIEIARLPSDGDQVANNALKFMNALVRAGVAARLPTREKGYAPTSNGFVRFALIRDLGPLQPVAGTVSLINPNEGERFIPYADAKGAKP